MIQFLQTNRRDHEVSRKYILTCLTCSLYTNILYLIQHSSAKSCNTITQDTLSTVCSCIVFYWSRFLNTLLYVKTVLSGIAVFTCVSAESSAEAGGSYLCGPQGGSPAAWVGASGTHHPPGSQTPCYLAHNRRAHQTPRHRTHQSLCLQTPNGRRNRRFGCFIQIKAWEGKTSECVCVFACCSSYKEATFKNSDRKQKEKKSSCLRPLWCGLNPQHKQETASRPSKEADAVRKHNSNHKRYHRAPNCSLL